MSKDFTENVIIPRMFGGTGGTGGAGAVAAAIIAAIGLACGFTRETPKAAGPVTFARHVAPILFRECASCHRPGEAAPFSVLSYPEVRRRAGTIVDVIE